MELYREHGFESTTVAEIAERAGLTERTFFRHFADKREVLFSGASALREFLVSRVDTAPASVPAFEAIVTALMDAATDIFEGMQGFPRQRQAIIAANLELQEREQIKMATLASDLADALRRRGVAEPAASLAAEAGIAVFKVAFEHWTSAARRKPLADIIRDFADQLKTATNARTTTGRRSRQVKPRSAVAAPDLRMGRNGTETVIS
jgi:AcrR family transcriptional regulator